MSKETKVTVTTLSKTKLAEAKTKEEIDHYHTLLANAIESNEKRLKQLKEKQEIVRRRGLELYGEDVPAVGEILVATSSYGDQQQSVFAFLGAFQCDDEQRGWGYSDEIGYLLQVRPAEKRAVVNGGTIEEGKIIKVGIRKVDMHRMRERGQKTWHYIYDDYKRISDLEAVIGQASGAKVAWDAIKDEVIRPDGSLFQLIAEIVEQCENVGGRCCDFYLANCNGIWQRSEETTMLRTVGEKQGQ
jgi:hypothetical protein